MLEVYLHLKKLSGISDTFFWCVVSSAIFDANCTPPQLALI